MSNIEKAAESLYAHRQSVGDFPDGLTVWEELPETWREEWREAAQALADVGLIAPDLPEPDVTSANGTPVWRADKTLMVNAFHNMVGMWVSGTGEAQYAPAEARAQALALLAAANYAETSHEPDQRQT